MNYTLHFHYVYTFYRFGEEEFSEAVSEEISLKSGDRFTLRHQADGSFILSEKNESSAILTFPNKDNLLLCVGEEYELAYDEFVEECGDPCHNVCEGTVTLTVA